MATSLASCQDFVLLTCNEVARETGTGDKELMIRQAEKRGLEFVQNIFWVME